jgi:hypothetical protein
LREVEREGARREEKGFEEEELGELEEGRYSRNWSYSEALA